MSTLAFTSAGHRIRKAGHSLTFAGHKSFCHTSYIFLGLPIKCSHIQVTITDFLQKNEEKKLKKIIISIAVSLATKKKFIKSS